MDSYTYNLAGLLATETYPTGRVLTQTLNGVEITGLIVVRAWLFKHELRWVDARGLGSFHQLRALKRVPVD